MRGWAARAEALPGRGAATLPLRAARLGSPSRRGRRGRRLPAASAGKAGLAARRAAAVLRGAQAGSGAVLRRVAAFCLLLLWFPPKAERLPSQKRHSVAFYLLLPGCAVARCQLCAGHHGLLSLPVPEGIHWRGGAFCLWRSTGRARKREGLWSTVTGAGLRPGFPLALASPMCVPQVRGKTS